MKNNLKLCFSAACIGVLMAIAPVQAVAQIDNRQQVVGIPAGDSLNVRTGPGGGFPDIGDISKGTAIPVLGYNATGRWAKVLWRNQEAWVSATYLSGGVGGEKLNKPYSPTQTFNGPSNLGPHVVAGVHAVDPRGLALRSGPGTQHSLEQYLGDGVDVFVVSVTRNGRWGFIRFSNGTGYVSMKYLQPTGNRGGQSSQNGQSAQTGQSGQTGQGSSGVRGYTEVPAPDGLPLPAVFTVSNILVDDPLNVRHKPRVSGLRLAQLRLYEPITVLAYMSNGWARIAVGEKVGFVNAKFLTRGGGVQTQSGMQLGLMCRGTEPFWSLDLDEDRSVQFSEINTGNEPLTSLTQASPSTLTNSYPYTFAATPYSGTLEQQICSDGMSDIDYGWRMTLVKPRQGGGWETLNGCCSLQ